MKPQSLVVRADEVGWAELFRIYHTILFTALIMLDSWLMIKTSSKQFGSAHVIIIAILVVGLFGVLGVIFWNSFMRSKPETSTNESTSLVKGKVTEKNTNCGREILDNDGKPKRVAGICDAGNSIIVNEIRISTGGGALTANPPKYITNVESVHAGDEVEIRYILDKNGRPSTDCESCYIKKEGMLQKEPQDKQGSR